MSAITAAKALLECLDQTKVGEENPDIKGLKDELRNNIIAEESKLPDPSAQEVRAAMVEVNDMLNKGWIEETKKYLQAFLDGDESLGRPMSHYPYIGAFESSFKTACRKHNIIAAYVVVETEKVDNDENKRIYKLITGGMHLADALVTHHLKPLANSLGQDIGPKKPFLDIQKIEQRNPMHIK